jgi:enoyl-CoA hydratase/carnithine racemase
MENHASDRISALKNLFNKGDLKMNGRKVIVDKGKNFVGEVILNRPEKLNTMDSETAAALYQALMEMETSDDVRVVLLMGSGRAFCAGVDLNELADRTAMEYREWIEKMERPLAAVAHMKKPVIARVQGAATANGFGLVAAADLAIAGRSARMGLTAVKVGLNCVGPVLPVARCVGRKKALELLLFGDMIDADEALNLGLVNRVVADEDLEGEARRWAEELALMSPIAVQIAKSAFYASEDMPYDVKFSHMNEAFARLCTTADAKEGVRAFLEKRKAVWEGR